jgi:hypothetical protein
MAYIGNTAQTVLRTSTFITASAGQTVFNIPSGYNLNAIDVFVNGYKLVQNQDYTADDGLAVTMSSGLNLSDEVEIVVYGDYQLQNTERQIPRSRRIHVFTAGVNQDTYVIPGGFYPNTLDVFLNGVRLIGNGTDYTDSSGTQVVLTSYPNQNDEIHVVVYSSFVLANAVAKTGDTLLGDLNTQNLLPDGNNTRDIGSSSVKYRDLYIEGTVYQNGTPLTSSGNAWITKTHTDTGFTASSGDRIFVDTSGASANVTINLPASPSVGDNIRLIDVAGTFGTTNKNLIVGRNNEKIMNSATDMTVSDNNSAFELVYSGSTYGWVFTEV